MNLKLSDLKMKRSVIGSILFAALLLGCTGKEGNPEEKEGITVRVVHAKASEKDSQHNYVGTIEEIFSSSLSFEVAGNVDELHVREGQRVYKGQLLASLNKSTLRNSHDAALSTLKQAEDAYGRMKVLYDNKSLPEIKWIEVQTSLQQAKSMESIAKKSLDDCCLYAPFSGVIAERHIETGTNVMPGMPSFKLVAVDKVKLKIAVPEKEIKNIHVGQPATIKVAALDERRLQGDISEKNVTANPLSHTYDVKVALDNPDGELMPGMVCNVNIAAEEKQKNIIVPARAVQVNNAGETFVWLAVDDRAMRRTVETGGFSNNDVIISHGLTEGEQVIIEGGQKVSEGMKIIVR